MVYVSTSWGLASDQRPSVQSVPLGLFYPEYKAHDCLWLWWSGEGAWPLLSGLVVWFVRMCGWVVIDLVLRWRNWGWVAHLTSVLWGTEMQSAGSRLSIWLTHRLSCGPGSWDLLCEGLGHPEYLPGALPVVTGVPDSPICFPGGVVDPVGWDYSWVPRALHLKCRSSFFVFVFVFLLWKKFKVKYWGCLD